LVEEIKKSFDIIGEIVILEIPEEFDEYKYTIGERSPEIHQKDRLFIVKPVK
jgi:tRNA (guanine37-N1)-methyltransferase